MPQIYAVQFFCGAQIATTPTRASRIGMLLTHVAVGATKEMNISTRSSRAEAITFPVKGLATRKRAVKRTPVQGLSANGHNVPNQGAAPNWRQNGPY